MYSYQYIIIIFLILINILFILYSKNSFSLVLLNLNKTFMFDVCVLVSQILHPNCPVNFHQPNSHVLRGTKGLVKVHSLKTYSSSDEQKEGEVAKLLEIS